MDGMHDLGGKQGFGRIAHVAGAQEEGWEPLARALHAAALKQRLYNMDEYRHAIERMAPPHYISASYFERMLTATATLLVEKGFVSAEQLAALAGGAFPLARPVGAGRPGAPEQKFAIGETVRVKNEFVSGHTRMPGYVRGKQGLVVAISSPTPFPDAAAHNLPAPLEPSYDLRFHAQDLWPGSADMALVHAGVFQSYLEKISAD